MTRQYKSTDEELRERSALLRENIDKNNEEIEALEKRKQQIADEKRAEEAKKEEEKKELNTYIETMNVNF